MALCTNSCCNADLRNSERQANIDAFDAFMAAREGRKVRETFSIEVASNDDPANDRTYGIALIEARIGATRA